MSDRFSHIDDKFKDAFENWEPEHSRSEMVNDWNDISGKLPRSGGGNPATSAPSTGGLAGGGIRNLFIIAGAAALLTTAAVVSYNSLNNEQQDLTSGKNIEARPVEKPQNAGQDVASFPEEKVKMQTPQEQENEPTSAPEELGSKIKNKIAETDLQQDAGQSNEPARKVTETLEPAVRDRQAQTTLDDLSDRSNRQNSSTKPPVVETYSKEQIAERLKNLLKYVPNNVCIGETVNIPAHEAGDAVITWGEGSPALYHTYRSANAYTVTIKQNDVIQAKKVNVVSRPEAHFVNFYSNDLLCKFRNTSLNAREFIWDFGDGSPAMTTSNGAEHQYRDSGYYMVTMIARNSADCADTTAQRIYVSPYGKPYISNVLTPNADGHNDVFEITIEDYDIFELIVIDQQSGRTVFETNDNNIKWNGKFYNRGDDLSVGVYLYRLKYRYAREGLLQYETGTVEIKR